MIRLTFDMPTRVRTVLKKRHQEGCLTDCVAYLLNLHPNKVPLFIHPEKGWNERLKRFFRRRGYELIWLETNTVPKRGTHIVVTNGDKEGIAHAVVYTNGKKVYDPAYPKNRKRRITHRILLIKKDSITPDDGK